jgi:hypothetical protein|tara:strand:- start:1378 stop:1575 length:198 start_codon:yes stop_codon:yes gene_type:complete
MLLLMRRKFFLVFFFYEFSGLDMVNEVFWGSSFIIDTSDITETPADNSELLGSNFLFPVDRAWSS